jgi:sulfur relay (sulfurtransferase) complex TusBCD TusD component (DsrE family)
MNIVRKFALALTLLVGLSSLSAAAGSTDPLFVNLTTDDAHRVEMALHFGAMQAKRGHPLTLFLNDKGVLAGSKVNAGRYAEQQKTLTELIGSGVSVIACPLCMKHYGVQEADLLPGIKVGNPELTGNALFKDNTRTLTW